MRTTGHPPPDGAASVEGGGASLRDQIPPMLIPSQHLVKLVTFRLILAQTALPGAWRVCRASSLSTLASFGAIRIRRSHTGFSEDGAQKRVKIGQIAPCSLARLLPSFPLRLLSLPFNSFLPSLFHPAQPFIPLSSFPLPHCPSLLPPKCIRPSVILV